MKIYSTQEVANKLGVSRQRVHQLIKAGRIPFEWVGKTRIIYEVALKQFMKERASKQ